MRIRSAIPACTVLVRFLDPSGEGHHTPFSLMLLTLGATSDQKNRYASLAPGFWMARG